MRRRPTAAGLGASSARRLIRRRPHGVHLGRAEAALFRASGATLVSAIERRQRRRCAVDLLGPRVALDRRDQRRHVRGGRLGPSLSSGRRCARPTADGPDDAGSTDRPGLARLAARTRLVGEAFDSCLQPDRNGAPADLVILDYPRPPVNLGTLAAHWTFGISARSVRAV
jgi:hypothetical protein